jgi:hypothetical protein
MDPLTNRTAQKNLVQLAKLRLLVGYLGEKKQCGWWNTGFLDGTGERFLELLFPRTALLAGPRSASEATRAVHDERILRTGTYHLFRLPVEIEDLLEEQVSLEALNEWRFSMSDKESALTMLDNLAQFRLDAPEGPVQVGVATKILRKDSISELAAHYHSAMSRGRTCYPYFAILRP